MVDSTPANGGQTFDKNAENGLLTTESSQSTPKNKLDSIQERLIVTLFALSDASCINNTSVLTSKLFGESNSKNHHFLSTLESQFTEILAVLVSPTRFNKSSSQTLSSYVHQISYLTKPPFLDPRTIRHEPLLTSFESQNSVEIVFDLLSNPSTPHRPIKLAIFDMDSTLIEEEVIDEIARSIGVAAAVSSITASAMNGEIDFEQSLRQRLTLLEGVNIDIWQKLQGSITIAAGARELCTELRKRGVVTAVASGGFAPIAEWLRKELGLDYAFANYLLTSPPTPTFPYEHLTGHLDSTHPIVTPAFKRDTLCALAAIHSIPLSQTLAVGDGSNDLLMLDAAGMGVAWKAKPRVQKEAPQRLNGKSLTDLLYLFGDGTSGS